MWVKLCLSREDLDYKGIVNLQPSLPPKCKSYQRQIVILFNYIFITSTFSGKMLLVRIIENDKIDAYFSAG